MEKLIAKHSNIPVLESSRLLLRPLGINFLSENYVNWLNDKYVTKYMSNRGTNFEDLKTYLEKLEKNPIYFWALILKKGNLHIGNIKIDPINTKQKKGEYGIMIGEKSYWGNGYGIEATLIVLNFCFKELDLDKILLGVIKENKEAVNMYKKIGFKILYSKNNYHKIRDKKYDFLRMYITGKYYLNNYKI